MKCYLDYEIVVSDRVFQLVFTDFLRQGMPDLFLVSTQVFQEQNKQSILIKIKLI